MINPLKRFYFVIGLLFTLSSSTSAQNSTEVFDDICIEVSRYFIKAVDSDELPNTIKNNGDLLIYLDKKYKKNNELKKVFKQIQEETKNYQKGDDLKRFTTERLLPIIKFDKKEVKTKDIQQIIRDYIETIPVIQQEKVQENLSENIKNDELLKQTERNEELRNENERLKNENKELNNNTIFHNIGIFAAICSILGLILFIYVMAKKRKKPLKKVSNNKPIIPQSTFPTNSVQTNAIKTTELTNIAQNQEWFVVGKSVIGKSHIESNIVCQDNCFIQTLDNNWGIAISCDGAGSAKNSDKGSKFVSEQSAKIFKAIIDKSGFTKSKQLPELKIWKELSKQGLYQTYKDLDDYSKKEGLRLESLACTVIIVVYSPYGYLVTHIGDGRAGYLDENNSWKAMITPWKGDEANQTMFITSSIWNEQIDTFIESNVIETQSKAFTLMSDGCESHCFECSKINNETKEWSDPNLPFPKFFNPLVNTLKKFLSEGLAYHEIEGKWSNFLEKGTDGLKNEPDDKTLILGILQTIN